MLTQLRAASGPARQQVLRLTIIACDAMEWAAGASGHDDLALHVAALATASGAELGDPVLLGMVAAYRSLGLSRVGVGAYQAAARIASDAADVLAPAGGREAAAAVGDRQLAASCALAALGNGEEVAARLAEAEQLATRLDGPTLFGRYRSFGVANTRVRRISGLLELGEPDQAVAGAGNVPLDELTPNRRNAYWIDVGRAQATLQRDAQAVTAFRRAEAISPLKTRMHPMVRETVAGMVGRVQRAAVSRELRGLAYRLQIPH